MQKLLNSTLTANWLDLWYHESGHCENSLKTLLHSLPNLNDHDQTKISWLVDPQQKIKAWFAEKTISKPEFRRQNLLSQWFFWNGGQRCDKSVSAFPVQNHDVDESRALSRWYTGILQNYYGWLAGFSTMDSDDAQIDQYTI